MRILVAGGPRVGKTTLAERLSRQVGIPVLHTDDVICLGWSAASFEVSTWFEEPGPWIVEGVAVPRALRKWLERHEDGTPAEVLHWSATPVQRQATFESGACGSGRLKGRLPT